MTVATLNSYVTYTGNNATTVFPYTFKIPTGTIQVYLWSVATGSVLLNPANYSVTGLNNPAGGTVTYPLAGPPITALQTITISRSVPAVQSTDISSQANFYPAVIEDALDYLTFLYQQLSFSSTRALLLPIGDPTPPTDYLSEVQAGAADAAASAAAAAASASSASTWNNQALIHANDAFTSKTAAAASATAAAGSATAASGSATAAAASATTASTQATNAAASAVTASTQATNSANSATASANSATTASTQAGIATTQAGNAAASAAAALASQNSATTSAATATTQAAAALASANSVASRTWKNLLARNGGFEVWQRGAGGAASIAVPALSSTGLLTVDGWYLFTNANQASAVSQQAGLTNGSQWCAKVQRNAGETGIGGYQFGFALDTDELFPFLGQFVRLSFTAKAGANFSPASGTVTAVLLTGTGAAKRQPLGFTGQATAIGFAQNLTGAATRYQGNSAAIIPTNIRQAEVTFLWTPVGTAGADDSFSIDDVQLEIVPAAAGYVSTDFERRNFSDELQLCERQFAKTFVYGTAPAQNVGANTGEMVGPVNIAGASVRAGHNSWQLPSRMRIAPTITTFNPAAANNQVRNITSAVDHSVSNVTAATDSYVYITSTGNAAGVLGDRAGVHLTADAAL